MPITTISVSMETAAKLDRLSKANKVTKKEYISCALEYFEKYGINPVKHESPAQEMQTLIKRVNQIVAFIRKQEKDVLHPLCEATTVTNARIENVLSDLLTVKRFEGFMGALDESMKWQEQKWDEREKRLDVLYERISNLLEYLGQ
jgi:ribosomal protein S15P/S13E